MRRHIQSARNLYSPRDILFELFDEETCLLCGARVERAYRYQHLDKEHNIPSAKREAHRPLGAKQALRRRDARDARPNNSWGHEHDGVEGGEVMATIVYTESKTGFNIPYAKLAVFYEPIKKGFRYTSWDKDGCIIAKGNILVGVEGK